MSHITPQTSHSVSAVAAAERGTGRTLGRAAPADVRELRGVGAIDLARDGVVYDIPQDVHAGHDAHEEDLRARGVSVMVARRTYGLTKKRSATLSATNHSRMTSPAMPRMRIQVLRRRRQSAQHPASAALTKRFCTRRASTQRQSCKGGNGDAPTRPPEREEEEHAHRQAGDLARVGVEPARDEGCTDE